MEFLPLLVAAILPALACVELAKAIRWWMLMGAARPDLARCLRALVAGQLMNALAPLRAGEALSVGLIRAEGGPLVAGSAALAGTKALDALCLAGIAATLLGRGVLQQSRAATAGAALILALGLALTLTRGRAVRRLGAGSIGRKLHLDELLKVAASARDPRTLLVLLGTSGMVWLAGLGANWLVLQATGTPPTLELAARMLVAGYVVGLLPAPPARIGVYEAGVVAALTSAGAALPQAAAAAVLLHACQLAELGLLLAASVVWTRWGSPVVVAPASHPS